MEARGIGRGGGRRFSKPESSGGPRVSSAESGLAIKDEEKVKFNSNKFRVYDKISLPNRISPLMKIAELEKAINNLQQPATEGVQQEAYLVKQYKCKITEAALKKQNEMLQKELESTKCLLEKQNQRAENCMAENVRLNKQVEELSIKFGKLQETHDKILHEKEEQKMEFESLHADLQDQLSSLAAAKKFLEEETKSLQCEVSLFAAAKMSLENERNSLQREVSSMAVAKLSLEKETNSLKSEVSSLAAAKMSLEKERDSLQSEMDKRFLASEEEKVNLKATVGELETALDSARNDLESSRAVEAKKEGQVFDLRHQVVDLRNELLDNAEANTCLKQKNNSLMTEMNKCTEENVHLQERIRELESVLNRLKRYLESKDVEIRELRKRQKPKENEVSERNVAGECKMQPKSTCERRGGKQLVKERTPKQVAAKQSPNSGPEIAGCFQN